MNIWVDIKILNFSYITNFFSNLDFYPKKKVFKSLINSASLRKHFFFHKAHYKYILFEKLETTL